MDDTEGSPVRICRTLKSDDVCSVYISSRSDLLACQRKHFTGYYSLRERVVIAVDFDGF